MCLSFSLSFFQFGFTSPGQDTAPAPTGQPSVTRDFFVTLWPLRASKNYLRNPQPFPTHLPNPLPTPGTNARQALSPCLRMSCTSHPHLEDRMTHAQAEPACLTPSDEKRLIQETLSGNPVAFGLLYHAYYPRILGFLKQRCSDIQTAEDITQDAFVKAFVNLRSFRGQAALTTWLTRIAINEWKSRATREAL